MTSSKKPATEQSQRFKEAAHELGCDDSEERFREVMRRVAKAKPAPKDDKGDKPRRERQ